MHRESEEKALFDTLYREYLTPLKKYAYKIGVGYDDVEDMVQETFIEYYKRYALDLDHRVKRFLLLRIMRSKWIDICRRTRQREILYFEDPKVQEKIRNLMMNGNIRIKPFEQDVADRDIYRETLDIVKSMKRDWRDVLILRIFEELSTEEACEILQIKSTVCCTRLYRAKAYLKERVKNVKVFDN